MAGLLCCGWDVLMKQGMRGAAARIMESLCRRPEARLSAAAGDQYSLERCGAPDQSLSASAFRELLSRGLLVEAEPSRYAASPVAASWLKRRSHADRPFRMQHGTVETAALDDVGPGALVDLDESPVGSLARRRGPDGSPWLPAPSVNAGERLRRDFELGQLQPRVTANWSASVNSRRRTGDAAGLTNLTDMAIAARRRFDSAISEVGPELSDLLIDVCCFLKGLETVERERQWPARSAKLVLRIALERLARHYGYEEIATGRPDGGRTRHWGADDYRPKVS
jgi:hypothetical protein